MIRISAHSADSLPSQAPLSLLHLSITRSRNSGNRSRQLPLRCSFWKSGNGSDITRCAWHAHALTGLALLAAVTADQAGAQRWHNIPFHALGALPVVAGAYWIARRIALPNTSHTDFGRIAYSWIGTGMMLWVLDEAVPAPWIAVSWIVFAVALALVMRWIGYRHLAWQANVVAACTLVQVYTSNFTLEHTLWPEISLRLVTVSIVAAGLYFLSRKATVPDSPFSARNYLPAQSCRDRTASPLGVVRSSRRMACCSLGGVRLGAGVG